MDGKLDTNTLIAILCIAGLLALCVLTLSGCLETYLVMPGH